MGATSADADDVKMPKKWAELIGPPINGHPSNVASQRSKGFQDQMHSVKIGSLSAAKTSSVSKTDFLSLFKNI